MRSALIPIIALLMSVALLLMAGGLLGVLLPVRALIEGFSSLDIGIMGAGYFAGFGAGCLLGPVLVRRVGHIRTFAALTAIVSTLALLHAMFDQRLTWWLARIVTGLCFSALFMVIESWLNERSTNENRGLVFSIYTIINLTVVTLGQLALLVAAPDGFVLFAVCAILVSLSTVPVALSTATAPAPIANIHVRPEYLFKKSHVGVLGCLGIGFTNGAFWTLAPLYAQRGDPTDTGAVALFMSLAVLAGAVGQWPLGRLSDHIDRRRVIALACTGAALGGAALVSLPLYWPGALYAGAVLYGLFAFPLYALCVAHLNDFIEPGGYVEAASGLLLVYAVGAIAGPLLASSLMGLFGHTSLFAYTAIVHISIAVYAAYRINRHTTTFDSGRADFAETLVMTKMFSAIDPQLHPHGTVNSEEDNVSRSGAPSGNPSSGP